MFSFRATASSYVRSLRRRSSAGRGPWPKRDSNFWNWTRVAPKLWKLRIMLLLKPVTIETIAITVATPTTIPRTVRNARSLWVRTARKAKRVFSPNPRRKRPKSFLIPSFRDLTPFGDQTPTALLVPERFDRIEAGRLHRRIQSEEDPHGHRDEQADEHSPQRGLRRQRGESAFN